MSEKYPIASIGRLRMGNDGPGIRTLVAVSGCPLRCKYCINPYTWDGSRIPQMMTASELYDKIIIDRPYILATNGGITFGGGEPLLHSGLIGEIRNICEPEMTIYVETSFNIPWQNIESVVEIVDCFYVDIKSVDYQVYKDYTGGDLKLALDNLKRMIESRGADKVVVRVPEIPGCVDKKKQKEAKAILEDVGVKKFNIFKYHKT